MVLQFSWLSMARNFWWQLNMVKITHTGKRKELQTYIPFSTCISIPYSRSLYVLCSLEWAWQCYTPCYTFNLFNPIFIFLSLLYHSSSISFVCNQSINLNFILQCCHKKMSKTRKISALQTELLLLVTLYTDWMRYAAYTRVVQWWPSCITCACDVEYWFEGRQLQRT